MRRPSTSTRVASGPRPRSEIADAPGVKPVPLLEIGRPPPLATGRFLISSSAVRSPDLLIRSRLMFKTGFGPTSSAVGMFEPVTIMRSVSAVPPVAVAPAAGAAVGVGFCAKTPVTARSGIDAPTARAVRTRPNLLTTVLIISFSIGVWLGLGVRIKEEIGGDKRFFSIFQNFFERYPGRLC